MYINRKLKYKLQYKVNAVFSIALTLILLVVIATSIWLSGRELIAKDQQLIEKIGESIILSLQKNVAFSENIVATMASLAVINRDRESLKKQLSFQMKAMANNSAIAGGGVWPRPYTLDPNKKKASLFWIRKDSDSFSFSEDYNQADVTNYFTQEWYLPVQFSKKKGCYWSRSYIDEFSKEPMVTCSQNMLIDGISHGVSTVDISLKGLREKLEINMQVTQGYAFVLDRNDAFIAAPSEYYQKSVLGIEGPALPFDSALTKLSLTDENFKSLASIIDAYRTETRNTRDPLLESYLVKTADDIDVAESINIVDYLRNKNQSLNIKRFIVESDPIFNEEVELVLLHMPNTDWLVALIVPERLVIARAKEVSIQLLIIMGIGILLGSIFLSYQLHHMLVKPLRSMITILRAHQDEEITLDDSATEELAELAEAYNRKQRALNTTNAVLLSANQRHQSVLDTAIEGILSLDTNFFIVKANPAAHSLFLGFHKTLLGNSFCNMLDKPSYQIFIEWIDNLNNCDNQHQELSVLNPSANTLLTIECSASHGVTNDDQFITLFIRDVSERKANELALNELATKDNLTKLANRNAFNLELKQKLKMADRQQLNIALLFIDLDYFKAVNDTYGHLVGDELLIQVANKLAAPRRSTDLVARLGGDEFAIIISHFKHIENVCKIAQKIIDELRITFIIDGNECQIGASIGIAIYPDHSNDANSLIKQADFAMYQAKEAGRNSWRLFANEQHLEQQRVLRFITELEHAISNDELRLHFQPIKTANSPHSHRCECLVRWQHPTNGLLMPNDFISIAETSGLIIDLGSWVLKEACLTLATWQQQGIVLAQVSINISAIQLQRGNLVEVAKKLLEEHQLNGNRLTFEITESLLMDKQCTLVLQQLAALGIELAIDDFGTGYSSLNYLQEYPVNVLKIDRSFVAKLQQHSDAPVCRAIIVLAHSLNLKVVAEGVETPFQEQLLNELECDALQGYLICKPLCKEDYLAWLTQNKSTQLTAR
ncbi:MAG: EAL domain-containing protein [Oceanospirillaceae bacterium]